MLRLVLVVVLVLLAPLAQAQHQFNAQGEALNICRVWDGTDVALVDASGNLQTLVTDGSGALNVIVDSSALPSGAATSANQSTANTSLGTIAGAVAGTEMQVDVLTMPTTTVQATNLDIRDLTSSDVVTCNAGTGTLGVDPSDEDARVLGRTKIHDGTDTALVSGSGSLQVTCDNCGGASPFEDEDAFTVGTSSVAAIGYLVDETTPDSAPEDSAAAPRMSPNRVPYAMIRDAAGNERGVNVTATNALKVDGSAVTQPISGTVTATATDLDIRDLTSTDVVTAAQATASNLNAEVQGDASDGAAVSGKPVRIGGKDGSGNTQDIITDTSGELQVDVLTMPVADVTATDLDIRNLNAAQDVVTVADDAGNEVNSSTSAPGAAARGWVVRQIGPCQNELPVYFPVDIVTATTVLVATGAASEHVYICGLNLVTAGANNVAIVAGTGATCGTSTAGMNGGATAGEGWNFAANGGIVLPNTGQAHMRTETTNDSVCIITSAAVQLSGTIAYVIQ